MSIEVTTYANGVDGVMKEAVHEFETVEEALQFMVRYNEVYERERMSSPRKSAIISNGQFITENPCLNLI